MIKVSILIPLWNQQDLIRRCLDSIPKREDIEIIVVDDCSTDDSFWVVKKDYPNVFLYRNDTNLGVGSTRNRLLEKAQGEYIFFLDSDDYLYPEEFSYVVDNLLKEDVVENLHKQNNGCTWYCHVYRGTFIRNSLAKQVPFKNLRCHEDTYWKKDLTLKFPKASKSRTGKAVYHYDAPRAGSLTDLNKKKSFSGWSKLLNSRW